MVPKSTESDGHLSSDSKVTKRIHPQDAVCDYTHVGYTNLPAYNTPIQSFALQLSLS